MFPVDSKILVVEDSSFTRNILKSLLREQKYWKILEANNPIEAQRLLSEPEQKQAPVHLILLDLHMPEMSGIDFLKWIRNQEVIKQVPIIVITTSQERSEIVEAGRLGISQFMMKPVDGKSLAERMSNTWQRHGKAYVESLRPK